jgi:hypothetical protein
MANPGESQGEQVIVNEERPILYDHKGNPLKRPTGFRVKREVN